MYKSISFFLMLCVIFGSTMVLAQTFSFQPPNNPQATQSSSRVLSPAQFRNKVQTESAQNRRELINAANKNAKPLTGFPKVSQTPQTTQQTKTPETTQIPPNTGQPPMNNNPTEEQYTQKPTTTPIQPSQKSAPPKNAPVYTGFPSNGGTDKSSNPSGGGWNIQY